MLFEGIVAQRDDISEFKSLVKFCHLPVVFYKEDDEYVAECPLFYVSSHGHDKQEALHRVKEALILYLKDNNILETHPYQYEYTREEMLKKAEELFYEYSEPDEEVPIYEYQEIDICIHLNV